MNENEMTIKLADSIKKAKSNMQGREFSCELERNFFFAEQLIESGVIVPPCNVGDTVYFTNESYHDSGEIDGIHIDANGIAFTYVQYEYGPDITEVWDDGEFSIDEIGKTVFLTREAKEEAEKALKARANNE